MLDFNEIQKLIPAQGQGSFTVSQGRDGTLVVLLQPIYPAIENVPSAQKKAYEEARGPILLKGTPAELNQHFMDGLKQTHEAENSLQAAFSKKTDTIQKTISPKSEKNVPIKKGGSTVEQTENPKEGPSPVEASSGEKLPSLFS